MTPAAPRILGTGHALPESRRTNGDPIFHWLREHAPPGTDLFHGYDTRHVLAPDEDLLPLLLAAARRALAAAGREPGDIDLVLGYASVSPYSTPNELARLAHGLGLSEHAWTIPLNNEFTNFQAGLLLADALIRSGRARHVLVAVGCNWTRHIDYRTPQAISAGDGAAAAVVGLSRDPGLWQVVDHQAITQPQYFGTMYMRGDPVAMPAQPLLWTTPYFHITEHGRQGFIEFGRDTAATAVLALLERHGLTGADIALISHQASALLLDRWRALIQPAQHLQALAALGNMTLASIPVLLDRFADQIARDALVLFGLGPEMHAHALLLGRTARQ